MFTRTLVTGKTGTVGSNLKFGVGFSSKDFDLRSLEQTERLFAADNPDSVVHCAAKVGGLKFHMEEKYKLFHDNLLINTNVIEVSRRRHIKRVLSFLSSCIFSDKSKAPYTEAMIHDGEPFAVHYPYGYAKRMLEVQSRICFDQFGLNYNCVIPTNIYGPHDDFNFETGHVVGVLIRKAYNSYVSKEDFVVWGDGNQEREFLFAPDVANLTEWVLQNYLDKEPLIFCNNQPVKIKTLASIIAKKFGVENRLKFDTSKPSGQQIRSLDGNKIIGLTHFNFTPIEEGLDQTIDWFLGHYPNVRV